MMVFPNQTYNKKLSPHLNSLNHLTEPVLIQLIASLLLLYATDVNIISFQTIPLVIICLFANNQINRIT